jgi:4'-phosphopantetheinyl transferase
VVRDAADVVVVFRDTRALAPAEIAAAVETLSDEERARFDHFHFAEDARDYAAAHALLRVTLSKDTERSPRNWQFERTAAGKPVLAGDDASHASFSLTHTRGMVACAVTTGADVGVGVDIERIDREVDVARIASRFFAASEIGGLARVDEPLRRHRFFDVWTLKEALVKALGGSLLRSLDAAAFDVERLDADNTIVLSAPPDVLSGPWQFALFSPASEFRGALAVRRQRERSPLAVTIRSDNLLSHHPAD